MTPTTSNKTEAGISKVVFYTIPLLLAIIGFFLKGMVDKFDTVHDNSIRIEQVIKAINDNSASHWDFCQETKRQVNDHEKRIIWLESKQPRKRVKELDETASSNNGANK